MSECDGFRVLATVGCPAEDARLQRHAARCCSCSEQLAADRELRQLFEGITRPGPSLDFNRALRDRIHMERQLRLRCRWRLLVMQGYWLAAGLASALVITLIRWPSGVPSVPAICSVGAVFGAALIAPLVLLLSLRTGPLRLILNTMVAFKR